MTNHTLDITLNSTGAGATISVNPVSLDVKDGDSVTITLAWPTNSGNDISCSLDFNNGSQDPFNDTTNGSTSFSVTRSNPSTIVNIMNDASVGSDSYCITLTLDGQTYTKDPKIVVKL